MPAVPYATGAYLRTQGDLPPLRLVNMFVEKAKTSEQGVALQSRKGLSTVSSLVADAIYASEGVFSGGLFVLSANTLYMDEVELGAVIGTGAVSFAGYTSELVLTAGGSAYSFDGVDLSEITFPDSLDIAAVEFIGSLFIFIPTGTQKFYWSDPLDGRTVDSLNFASAEREGDNLLDVKALGDNLVLFGQNSIELWNHTGAADLPFTRLDQVAFDKGIHSTGCAAKIDNGLMWVGSDCIVYRWGEVPQRLSDHWLETKIEASAAVSAFAFQYQGHPFFCVRLDDATYGFDVATGEWCEFASYGEDNWIATCATQYGSAPYFGGPSVMQFDGWEDVGQPLERLFSAGQQIDAPLSINSLRLWANAGDTDLLTGQGSDPQVEMRFSDDAGHIWSDWEAESLGEQGEYRTRPEWRALGMFDAPGFLFEFRLTEPTDFRVSAVKVNDRGGGRAR